LTCPSILTRSRFRRSGYEDGFPLSTPPRHLSHKPHIFGQKGCPYPDFLNQHSYFGCSPQSHLFPIFSTGEDFSSSLSSQLPDGVPPPTFSLSHLAPSFTHPMSIAKGFHAYPMSKIILPHLSPPYFQNLSIALFFFFLLPVPLLS